MCSARTGEVDKANRLGVAAAVGIADVEHGDAERARALQLGRDERLGRSGEHGAAGRELVGRGVGISITSEGVATWYKRPNVTFVPISDPPPCSVMLAWWPQETTLVAKLAAVANEVRMPPGGDQRHR